MPNRTQLKTEESKSRLSDLHNYEAVKYFHIHYYEFRKPWFGCVREILKINQFRLRLGFVIGLQFLFLSLFAQSKAVDVQLSVMKKHIILNDGILLNIHVISMHPKKIKVHNEIYFDIGEQNNAISDGYFEVKAENPEETDSAMQGTTDCDKEVFGREYKFLKKGEGINYSFDLGCLYHFTKGKKYRIRFCYKLSRLNPSLKDVWSAWLTVKK